MVDGLAEDTNPDIDSDVVMSNDASASLQKKVKMKNILGAALAYIRGLMPVEGDFFRYTSGGWLNVTADVVRGDLDAVQVLTDAATIATDASLGSNFRVTLGDNRTLGNPTNAHNGQTLVWEIIQDGTGSRLLTLDTKFALGTTIASTTLTTTLNKRDFLTAKYNSTADKFYVTEFVKGY